MPYCPEERLDSTLAGMTLWRYLAGGDDLTMNDMPDNHIVSLEFVPLSSVAAFCCGTTSQYRYCTECHNTQKSEPSRVIISFASRTPRHLTLPLPFLSLHLRHRRLTPHHRLPRTLPDDPEPIRPQMHPAIPPRHHDHDVPDPHRLEQVQQPPARRGLPVGVAVLILHSAVGIGGVADPPGRDVVGRAGHAAVGGAEVGYALARGGDSGCRAAAREEGGFLLGDGVGEGPGWR